MKKKLKSEHIKRMSRKFWIVLIVGTVVLLILTLVDLHYLSLTYFEPR